MIPPRLASFSRPKVFKFDIVYFDPLPKGCQCIQSKRAILRRRPEPDDNSRYLAINITHLEDFLAPFLQILLIYTDGIDPKRPRPFLKPQKPQSRSKVLSHLQRGWRLTGRLLIAVLSVSLVLGAGASSARQLFPGYMRVLRCRQVHPGCPTRRTEPRKWETWIFPWKNAAL